MSAKLLWNLCAKSDKLLVKWIHAYSMRGKGTMDYQDQGLKLVDSEKLDEMQVQGGAN